MRSHTRAAVAATVLSTAAVLVLSGCAGSASESDEPLVGLVVKTQDNPFYVKMTEGAQQEAEELGLNLQVASGDGQSDVDSQIKSIENFVAQGAEAILVTPAGDGIIPAIQKAQDAGVLVLALDSPLGEGSGVDGTFATDNHLAGVLVGEWAAAALGDTEARIATLDLSTDQIPVDVARNQGFLEGFGIDVADPTRMWDETDPRLAGYEVTDANEAGGRAGMEKLLQKDPTINLVYTINEPTAAGAYQAVVAAGLEDQITIVSVDGGCPGVTNVQEGVIAATSMQFPLEMAAQALQAVDAYLADGTKPENSPGLDFTNTGVTLITDQPQDGVESEDTTFGLDNCWG
jgi:fructose transport system substrate-binding protein